MLKPAAIGLAIMGFAANGAAWADAPVAPLSIEISGPGVKWGGCPPIFPGSCEMAVLQGDPSKPNADVVLRVGPGNALPRHKHSSAERMILIEGELLVSYDGAAPVTLKAANYAYGPAGLPHSASCTSKVACTLFIAFEGPVDAELVADAVHHH